MIPNTLQEVYFQFLFGSDIFMYNQLWVAFQSKPVHSIQGIILENHFHSLKQLWLSEGQWNHQFPAENFEASSEKGRAADKGLAVPEGTVTPCPAPTQARGAPWAPGLPPHFQHPQLLWVGVGTRRGRLGFAKPSFVGLGLQSPISVGLHRGPTQLDP